MDSGCALWVIRSWCKQCYQWLTGCREPRNAFYCPKTMSLFRFVSRSKLIWAVATHLSAGYLIRVTKSRQLIDLIQLKFPERPVQRGHDPDGGLQHAENNQGQCHDQSLGHWRTATVSGNVGAVLPGRQCDSVSIYLVNTIPILPR